MAKKEGKKNRKYGKNKVACKRYEVEGREERNKKRVKRRLEREYAHKEHKMLARIKKRKPVPHKWLVKLIDEVPL